MKRKMADPEFLVPAPLRHLVDGFTIISSISAELERAARLEDLASIEDLTTKISCVVESLNDLLTPKRH